MSRQRSSAFSFGSLIVTSKQDEFCYEDMTETELQQALESIAYLNMLLRLENDIFERYLARRDPECLQTIAQTLETVKRMQRITPQHGRMSPAMSITGSLVNVRDKDSMSVGSILSESRQVTPSILTARAPIGGTKITYAHRIEMINTEVRDLQKGFIKFEQTSTKKKIYLQARIEENEISIREISTSRKEFEESVVQKGVDEITGKIPAEKFIRFIEEWLKVADTIMERIRLMTITVNSQMRKVKLQLKQRTELGEALRAIDFEQLNIENQVCIRRIDEKNRYLVEMKRIAGRYSIALTRRKEKLEGLTSIVNELKDKIVSKKREIVELQSKQIDMEIEIEKTEKQLKSIIALIDEFNVPSVIDFIKMRIELQKVRKIHKQLSRQRKIQQMALRTDKK